MTRSGDDPDRPGSQSAQVNTPRTEPSPDGCHTVRTPSGPVRIHGQDHLRPAATEEPTP